MIFPQPESTPPDQAQRTFPAVRSLLAPEALCAEVQRAYRLGSVQSCQLLRSLTNDIYAVATAADRAILKVYGHGWRSAGEIAWELELLAHLARKGLAVPQAIPRVDGGLIGTLAAPEGHRFSVLFAFAEGDKPAAPSADLYQRFGRAVAHLHAATDDFSSRQPRLPFDLANVLGQAGAVILPLLAQRPADQAFVAHLAARTGAAITRLAAQGLDWGVCHGDVTLDNMHITAGRRIILYDFDSAGLGWRASDPYGVMTWLTRGKPQFWRAFLAGYQGVRTLTRADLAALPWFVPLLLLDNMRWHLSDWLALRGAASLDEGYLDAELATLRRWDREVLAGAAAGV